MRFAEEAGMKTVVVYESMFGNTKTIAEAIAEGLSEAGEVVVRTVDELSPDEVGDADLIVAGGPTHGHGMARQDAHRTLAKDASYAKYGPVLAGEGSLRGWLERLPAGRAAAATFDTRLDKPKWLTGSAATKIAQRLRHKGYTVVGTESFVVHGTGGPMADGERERAAAWGRELAASLHPTIAT
jgi:flavodoxin